jgi:hypothetical protein
MTEACGVAGVSLIEVGGRTYRQRFSGAQPLQYRFHSRDLTLAVGHDDRARVLAGVVGGSTTVSFRAYADGRPVGDYRGGRLWLLPVPPGRHEVRVVSSAQVAGTAQIVIGDYRRER